MFIKELLILILPIICSSFPLSNKILLEQQLKFFDSLEICNVSNIETCSVPCMKCNYGKIYCEFCKGTGFLMLGNDLIGTNNICVVCSGTGEKFCNTCAGTGNIANWLNYKI